MNRKCVEMLKDLKNRIDELAESVMQRYASDYTLDKEDGDTVYISGQIANNLEGRLHPTSLVIHNLRTDPCQTYPLNIDNIKTFSLFPGEVVVCRGQYVDGTFVADELYPGVLPKFIPPNSGLGLNRLSFVVACGPFTTTEGLQFEPLVDLLKYCNEHRPDICILCGPFLPVNHNLVAKCLIQKTFCDCLKELLVKVARGFKGFCTKFIVVSSPNDAAAHPIFPTPPYQVELNKNNREVIAC
ncbi:unnamed protein product [Soboliphyme baturini]|uniref:DNA polymerase alpha subunit B n=1 Tax=Soboliphyme baturini TaxID=241478 RepID=A0A183J9T5_9BILA|nr:unnamed protein product [Soboliphyme baturini]